MRFILLGAGRIAEKFVTEARFSLEIQSNLAGLIASQAVINQLNSSSEANTSMPAYLVGDKKCNEEELIDLIHTVRPDYLLSIQYPWILPDNILRRVSGRVLNLHNAQLPDYRGHNTISHEILNGETMHVCTLHWIAEEVDRGRIVKTREIAIQSDDTAYSLWVRSVESALCLLEAWFADLSHGLGFPSGYPVTSGGRYYRKEIAQKKQIPHAATPEIIDRWARAFWFPPHEPAYIRHGQRKLYVLPNTWSYIVNSPLTESTTETN